jgi:hypothetical protein
VPAVAGTPATPSVIASTPVKAVAPWENAFRIANNPTDAATVAACGSGSVGTPTDGHPPRQCTKPSAMSARIEITNPYVGTANAIPDSRVPRRFANVINRTKKIERKTRCSFASGKAEPIANTPATIETVTVIM